MSDLFEVSTRNKDRFLYTNPRGQTFEVGIEDLWDLRLNQLNEVFQTLKALHNTFADESLIEEESDEDAELSLQLEVVRYIFNVKKAEAEAKEQEAARREKKHRLQEILARKGEEALNNMSEEELQEMIKSL